MALTHAELLALAEEHVRCEIALDVEGVLATLEENTFYDIHPLGVRFSGRDAVRRYYEWLFTSFGPRQIRTELIATYVGDEGVVFENRLWFTRDDGSIACHDLIGIDVAGETKLKGEKIFGHRELIEAMVGPLLHEATPIDRVEDDRRLV